MTGTQTSGGVDNVAQALTRLRAGDDDAWRALSAAFRQRLRELAAAKLPAEMCSRIDASDVVQDTLAEANASIAAFEGRSLPELFAWMAAILNHNVTDAIREHLLAECRAVSAQLNGDGGSRTGAGWQAAHVADQTTPRTAAVRAELNERLIAAIDELPLRQRHAVRMRHLEGRPLSEIAAELRCTKQAAAAAIARGLRSLRGSIANFDG
jgi:RNA polymerase sigma-70 factor (ECF subfamily)